MLPDKNELNDESIEQINGGESGGSYIEVSLDSSFDDSSRSQKIPQYYSCLSCREIYIGYKPRTDGYCPNCEPRPLEVSIPTGDMQTTIPSNNKNAFKTH